MLKKTYLFMILGCFALAACAHQPAITQKDLFTEPVEEPRETVNSPGSLWTPDARSADLYADPKARHVGDIVLVEIDESSEAEKEAKTSADRSNSAEASISTLLGIPLDRSVLGTTISPTVSASSDFEFEGNGKTSRSGDITGSVSARVARVLPSGNMVINGKKQIRLNGEIQYIVLTGIIRAEDISQANSIPSTKIADMRLEYYGSGIMGDQQDRGFISKALDKVWPF